MWCWCWGLGSGFSLFSLFHPFLTRRSLFFGAPPTPPAPLPLPQVASKEFFLKTVPMFDGGDDMGMVLSPQCFHNLNAHADIFNHSSVKKGGEEGGGGGERGTTPRKPFLSFPRPPAPHPHPLCSNVHFWEYMQPGYDALGFISCTGTNFLARARALVEVGGSPTWTLTEDFALGMEMKRAGWHCRYVAEYLAIGEAPDAVRREGAREGAGRAARALESLSPTLPHPSLLCQVRNCYQQRSRWCKGHFQIFFSAAHCPLLQKGLSPFMRLLYCSGVWNYVVGAVSTPFFMAVPIGEAGGGGEGVELTISRG